MSYTNGLDKPTDYFNTVLWSNSSTQSVTGVGFQPDFVWVKNRSISQPHIVQDIVRGKKWKLIFNIYLQIEQMLMQKHTT